MEILLPVLLLYRYRYRVCFVCHCYLLSLIIVLFLLLVLYLFSPVGTVIYSNLLKTRKTSFKTARCRAITFLPNVVFCSIIYIADNFVIFCLLTKNAEKCYYILPLNKKKSRNIVIFSLDTESAQRCKKPVSLTLVSRSPTSAPFYFPITDLKKFYRKKSWLLKKCL